MSIIEKALQKKQKASKPSLISQAMAEQPDNETSPPAPEQAEKHDLANSQHQPNKAVLHIDTDRLERCGMVSHSNNKANPQITNEYRSIKRKIIHNAFGQAASHHENGNLVMISSSRPSEGKTFTSVNLALSLASEKDKTVLLVDADVLKPSTGKLLEIDVNNKPGLIDFLLGEVKSVSEVIYQTSIPNLRILPAGTSHHLSNELLASDKMASLTKELATRYPDRLVLFDCPPLLGVEETITVSKLLGQAMIVVEHGKTKMADVEKAISELNKQMAIGFIVNKAMQGAYSQYEYGYGDDYKKESQS
ncbi:XrtA-associated tyrosine autokinase [Photobacterium alginatilyticum]|uniref:non-specific protein-tyrosine kinase n=1 Tax=Photobacterium alginatilyticum TaxID=1775171 RepID=A0ABW9YFG3_9GAMM|nr:XrtA-associated tyrosine autokinase [Photobacterium alginatilyticum]NBI52501.1 exopolysaccharide biosynthesis protein [Photobacterium alginatilyticum]